MVKRTSSLFGLALNLAADATAPDWVQLTPAGPRIIGRDGRWWQMTDPQAVADRFDPTKEPQIDIEHSSQMQAPNGLPAPAVGWIKALEVRDGALWGRVEWTSVGAELVADRAYRYLSPVFTYDFGTGDIHRIVCAGLTNTPNLELAALNAAETESEEMDKAVLDALGLPGAATVADAVTAIATLKSEKAMALNQVLQPDPEKFVPKADHQLALNRITEFEAEAKARAEQEAIAAVDAAVAAGKVAPASRDYHLAVCREQGGLAKFKAFAEAAPVIAGPSKLGAEPPAGQQGKLSTEELAVCRQMGMTPEDFAAARAAEQKE
jgi:phage I-like protein